MNAENSAEPIPVFDMSVLPVAELTGHQWIQEGTMLICKSCAMTHATAIPFGQQLYGINDKGEPMIRQV